MATIIQNDILVTSTPGEVKMTLECGYGQPIDTAIYLKKIDGNSELVTEIAGNISDLILGQSSELSYFRIEVNSTIHDIRDFAPGQEVEDVKLYIKISCNEVYVDFDITKKTKGKGEYINCRYEVTIL